MRGVGAGRENTCVPHLKWLIIINRRVVGRDLCCALRLGLRLLGPGSNLDLGLLKLLCVLGYGTEMKGKTKTLLHNTLLHNMTREGSSGEKQGKKQRQPRVLLDRENEERSIGNGAATVRPHFNC